MIWSTVKYAICFQRPVPLQIEVLSTSTVSSARLLHWTVWTVSRLTDRWQAAQYENQPSQNKVNKKKREMIVMKPQNTRGHTANNAVYTIRAEDGLGKWSDSNDLSYAIYRLCNEQKMSKLEIDMLMRNHYLCYC